jgi:hypothetical protein
LSFCIPPKNKKFGVSPGKVGLTPIKLRTCRYFSTFFFFLQTFFGKITAKNNKNCSRALTITAKNDILKNGNGAVLQVIRAKRTNLFPRGEK